MPLRYAAWAALAALMIAWAPAVSNAAGPVSVTNDRATLKFPDWIAFSADLKSDAEIQHVVLEYGAEQLTCGTVLAKAFPQFTPARQATVRWTWEMKQSGSQPPGAVLWWRWRITTVDGRETVTDRRTVTWLDNLHSWRAATRDLIQVHWYEGGPSFAAELGDSAMASLKDLNLKTSLELNAPVDIYVYPSSKEMRDAIFYEPSWTGGRAYSDYGVIIIAIHPNDLAQGKVSLAHELTHVLVTRFAFSCLSDTPVWLSEGLAMYGQGGPDADSGRQFERAVASDSLSSVRALSSGFPESSDRADLAYTESYSLVDLLISQYGRDKLFTLIRGMKEGVAADAALQSTYGFDSDGLEDAWRAKIGAKPRAPAGRVTPTATPTTVRTLVPIPGLVLSAQATGLLPANATAAFTATPTARPSLTPGPTLTMPPAPYGPKGDADGSSVAMGGFLAGLGGLGAIGLIGAALAKRQARTHS